MDRLTPLDAAFLDAEDVDDNVALEIATVAVAEGSPPNWEEFAEALRARLEVVPRHRQRVRRLPLDLGQPFWEDTDVDDDYHVRRAALPSPGGDAELGDLVAMVMSERLDRDRPLWQCWLVEGLAGGRWAVVVKAHHCLADGVGGYQLLAAMFAEQAPAPPGTAVRPETAPGGARLALDALGALALLPFTQMARAVRALRSPVRLARRAAGTVRGLATLAGVLVPVAPSSLTGPLGRRRRYRVARATLGDVTEVRKAFGATVNDVVLAAIAGAFRELLLRRGEEPAADAVRTLVPVSVREDAERGVPGNRLSWLLPLLPVDVADPVARLAAVHDRLCGLKGSQEAEAVVSATTFAGHEPFAPVSVLVRAAARLPQRNVVTVTTNVPGPREPLWLFGHRIVELWPYVPIAVRLRTGVAVLSYGDQLTFGVTADFDSVPEAGRLARSIETGLAELVEAARARA